MNEVASNLSSSSNWSSIIKHQRCSNEDTLKDSVKENHYYQQLRNACFKRRVKRVMPIANHILVAVIEIDQFLIDRFNYLEEN